MGMLIGILVGFLVLLVAFNPVVFERPIAALSRLVFGKDKTYEPLSTATILKIYGLTLNKLITGNEYAGVKALAEAAAELGVRPITKQDLRLACKR